MIKTNTIHYQYTMTTEDAPKVKAVINGDIARDLECPICYDVLKDPRVFRICQHTFCFKCICRLVEQAIVGDVPHVYCPVCRRPERLTDELIRKSPDNWAEFFPKNIVLSNILDSLKVEDEYCDFHEHKLYEYFCEDHNSLCCSKCLLLIHRHCGTVTDLDELTGIHNQWRITQILNKDEGKTDMKTIEDMKSSILNESQEALSNLREVRLKVNEAMDKVEKKINMSTKGTLMELENSRLQIGDMKESLCSKGSNCNFSTPQNIILLLKDKEKTDAETSKILKSMQVKEKQFNATVSTEMNKLVSEVTEMHEGITIKANPGSRKTNLRFSPYSNQDRPLNLKLRKDVILIG